MQFDQTPDHRSRTSVPRRRVASARRFRPSQPRTFRWSRTSRYFVQEEFLTFCERLLLTAGVNAERSSNNGDQTKFYGYPKFSASLRSPWVPPTVGDLKLRLAYGRAGNFPTAGRFTFATTVFNEGIGGARFSTIKGDGRESSPRSRPSSKAVSISPSSRTRRHQGHAVQEDRSTTCCCRRLARDFDRLHPEYINGGQTRARTEPRSQLGSHADRMRANFNWQIDHDVLERQEQDHPAPRAGVQSWRRLLRLRRSETSSSSRDSHRRSFSLSSAATFHFLPLAPAHRRTRSSASSAMRSPTIKWASATISVLARSH